VSISADEIVIIEISASLVSLELQGYPKRGNRVSSFELLMIM
jgi:hypothetical protein